MIQKKKRVGHVEVIRERCISSSTCVALAPNTFELDGEGIAIVRNAKGDGDEVVLHAARGCPVNAIVVYDEDGVQIWPEA